MKQGAFHPLPVTITFLIMLDEVGYLTLDKTASDHLFQLISRASENVALIITCNPDFSDWETLFASPGTAAALLDRLLHHAHVITLRGDSYRVRNRLVPSKFTLAKEEREDPFQNIVDAFHDQKRRISSGQKCGLLSGHCLYAKHLAFLIT